MYVRWIAWGGGGKRGPEMELTTLPRLLIPRRIAGDVLLLLSALVLLLTVEKLVEELELSRYRGDEVDGAEE